MNPSTFSAPMMATRRSFFPSAAAFLGFLTHASRSALGTAPDHPPAPQPPATPARVRLFLNDRPFTLRHWTAEEWERTPEGERPSPAYPDDRGGRFAIEAEPDPEFDARLAELMAEFDRRGKSPSPASASEAPR